MNSIIEQTSEGRYVVRRGNRYYKCTTYGKTYNEVWADDIAGARHYKRRDEAEGQVRYFSSWVIPRFGNDSRSL